MGAVVSTLLSSAASAQLLARGNELQVNQSTAVARFPAVAAAANGRFVVVWPTERYEFVGDTTARRFDALGAALGDTFQVSTGPGLSYRRPAIAAAPGGGMVLAWEGTDESGAAIFARRLDAVGSFAGQQFQVNSYTTHHQARPDIAVEPDGDFVVTWMSYGQFGTGYGIAARRFDSSGAAVTAELQISLQTIGQNQDPAVAALPNGDFVIAWEGKTEIGFYYPVFARRFDAAGVAQATQFQVNGGTQIPERLAAVDAAGDGTFVVVWETSIGSDESVIMGRRFDASGVAQGAVFPVSTGIAARNPAITMDGAGQFVVAWDGYVYPSTSSDVRARRFAADGTAMGADFQVNSYTGAVDRFPRVTTDASGHYVIAWQRNDIDVEASEFTEHRILARRFGDSLAILDLDGDQEVGALTDGVLLLRQRFGFSGATLTAGAVGAFCSRCEAEAIKTYVQSILSDPGLDIDGDGGVGALTDALLILRFALGLGDAALTEGAVGAECSRCDPESIEAFIVPLLM